ncbi:unnamed protein product [Cylicostephanus goldi]|uniref:Uncharacterized protein n=1 Tax=Cylicostephanus goldi TaxID=71465 RepID=A0A3P7N9N5_CYLGO|nr:unnamed protein product [Cylicostephanus goldi]
MRSLSKRKPRGTLQHQQFLTIATALLVRLRTTTMVLLAAMTNSNQKLPESRQENAEVEERKLWMM